MTVMLWLVFPITILLDLGNYLWESQANLGIMKYHKIYCPGPVSAAVINTLTKGA